MPLLTTTIGAFPKSDYVPRRAWFHDAAAVGEANGEGLSDGDILAIHDRATVDVVEAQAEAGIDIPTDGDIRRENYIHYTLPPYDGVRAGNPDRAHHAQRRLNRRRAEFYLVDQSNGAVSAPRLRGCPGRDRSAGQDHGARPLTISDSTADLHYGDVKAWRRDLADALNAEITALAEAGCRYIQIDGPFFARLPDQALDYMASRTWSVVSTACPGASRAPCTCAAAIR